jgi:excisionase family DNA binding protein
MHLLTTSEAARYLKIDRKSLARLPIPFVMLGKRKRRYDQTELDKFVTMRIIYPHESAPKINQAKRRVPARSPALGVPRLPKWEALQALPVAQ